MIHQQKFYVTTPIYYATAAPHLGSLYSTILADQLARWQQLLGHRTFFLTGTDEHGQKIAQAAEKAGKSPKDFIDQFIPAYKEVWHQYEIAYNRFIRTTDEDHRHAVQTFIRTMMSNGDIYKGNYYGWYCTSCETFVAEKQENEQAGPNCGSCGRATHIVAEETYFFRLSAYQERLLHFYAQNPEFIMPRERAHEVINFVQAGLKDLSISRTSVSWGIPFPDDPAHIVYVWADALTNYLSGVGYPDDMKEYHHWWPANVQILGKDIVRFHAVYWIAFLMAAKQPLPKQLLVHGWITINQQKMSKSFGNVVDPRQLLARYGADQVRYYLLRQMAVNQDGDFSTADLEQRISSDLADDLGNLLQRMTILAQKNDAAELPPIAHWSADSINLRAEGVTMIEDAMLHMKDFQLHLVLSRIWLYIHRVNAFFHENEPWKVAKTDRTRFLEILSATAHSLQMIGIVVWPTMPQKMAQLLAILGRPMTDYHGAIQAIALQPWAHHFHLQKIEQPLFIKPEKDMTTELGAPEEKVVIAEPEITIEDLQKVVLATGTIEQCERVAGSDKMLKSQVNFGAYGMRQILSGIAQSYSPEQLIGKQAVFVINLKPRKMMGLESQGMLLVAEGSDGKVKIATIAEAVTNGMRLR